MKVRLLFGLAALAGCVDAKTPEGCPVYATPMMQAETQACQQAYYEEQARKSGGTVTKCFGGPGQMTCVSN